jgi:hypothetical protein
VEYYDKSNNYWGAGGERERECVACAEYLVVSSSDGRIITGWGGATVVVVAGQLINQKKLLS